MVNAVHENARVSFFFHTKELREYQKKITNANAYFDSNFDIFIESSGCFEFIEECSIIILKF
jgi:hypothetical protein